MSSYRFIRTQSDLSDYLESIRNAKRIDFDTEFITDSRYRTILCLVQVVTEFGPVLIDPLAVGDMIPFWNRLCDPQTLVTAHSARSEMEFCYKAIRRLPENLFDIQLAAAFVGIDYPASLKKLLNETLSIDLPKGETRTDWQARPLSLLQVEYALNDVLYLNRVADHLKAQLERMNRFSWFKEETRNYLTRMVSSFTDSKWQRIPGISKLDRRGLAIARELWYWREQKARQDRRNSFQILRNDVIIELAKLKTTDPNRLGELRSIHRRSDSAMYLEELPKIVGLGLNLPESELPDFLPNLSYPNYSIASSCLLAILHNEAKKASIAPSILASLQDARETVAYYAGTLPSNVTPRLLTGWRHELLGSLPEEIVTGKQTISFDLNHPDIPLRLL